MKFQMRKIHSVKLPFAGARTEKDEKCRNVAKRVQKTKSAHKPGRPQAIIAANTQPTNLRDATDFDPVER